MKLLIKFFKYFLGFGTLLGCVIGGLVIFSIISFIASLGPFAVVILLIAQITKANNPNYPNGFRRN